MDLSRRALLSLRLPAREEPPAPPLPFPAPDGAPALVRALEPLAERLREAAGEDATDIPVGAHTALDALPYEDGALAAVTSVLGVALTPRPKRAGRELLRVVRAGGLIALAAPTPSTLVARVLKMAGLPGPSPLRWGDEEALAKRLPGADIAIHLEIVRLRFESVEEAWEAVAEPFGVPRSRYDRFADSLAAHSPGAGELGLQDRWQLVLARCPS